MSFPAERDVLPSADPSLAGAAAGISPADTFAVASSAAPAARLHLDYLDGVRGFAGLWVIGNHLIGQEGDIWAFLGNWPMPFRQLGALLTGFFSFGHLSVDLFIVLSGFCLMLPFARKRMQMDGGAERFYRRRAHRILPPYFFCIAVFLAYNLLVGLVGSHASSFPPSGRVLLANIFLLEDVIPGTNGINGVFWSVAAEWKIYFLLPLFVLLWRRYNPWLMVTVAGAIGLALIPLIIGLFPENNLTRCCPWYVLLFAFGTIASGRLFAVDGGFAKQLTTPEGRSSLLRVFVPVTFLLALSALVCYRVLPPEYETQAPGWQGFQWSTVLFDVLFGALAASFLALLTVWNAAPGGNPFTAFFSNRLFVRFGIMGYSLYLTHPLALLMTDAITNKLHVQGFSRVVVGNFLALFLILLLCLAFYYAVEKRFLNTQVAGETRLSDQLRNLRSLTWLRRS